MAAATGAMSTPTAPTVSGISMRIFSSSLRMMSRRTFPSWTSSFTLPNTASPVSLNRSVYVFSSFISHAPSVTWHSAALRARALNVP